MKRIQLNGQVQSDLDWSKEEILAQEMAERGEKILWEIDLGLFSRLPHPLSNETMFHTLTLSLKHFVDRMYSKFAEATLGIILYKGSLDFSNGFPFEEEISDPKERSLYCRNICSDYLELLDNVLPEEIQTILEFDARSIEDPLFAAELSTKESFPHFQLWIEGSEQDPESSVGICFPSISDRTPAKIEGIRPLLKEFAQKQISYRMIPETMLTTEWHGLDQLYVTYELGTKGERMLQGFQAAGGEVVRASSPV